MQILLTGRKEMLLNQVKNILVSWMQILKQMFPSLAILEETMLLNRVS